MIKTPTTTTTIIIIRRRRRRRKKCDQSLPVAGACWCSEGNVLLATGLATTQSCRASVLFVNGDTIDDEITRNG